MVSWRTLLKINLFVFVAAAALSLVLFSIVNQVDCIDESGTLGRVHEGKGACMWTWALKFKLTDIMLVKFNTTYEGDWHEGKRHGRGEFVSATGHSYNGDWLNDRRHGQGEYRLSDGIVYSGEWEDNTLMGAGQVKFSLRQPRTFTDYPALSNATTFIGFFKDGFMHGRGAIYLTGVNEKKLDTVEGIFDEGRYIGKGTITLKDGEVVQVALLSNDWNVKTGKFALPSQTELIWDGSSFSSNEKNFNTDLPVVKELTQVMQGVHYFESKLAMTRIVVKSEPFNFTQHFEQKEALQQRLMKEMSKKQEQKIEL